MNTTSRTAVQVYFGEDFVLTFLKPQAQMHRLEDHLVVLYEDAHGETSVLVQSLNEIEELYCRQHPEFSTLMLKNLFRHTT